MNPEFKLGDMLKIKHADGRCLTAKISMVYNTKTPNYKLESEDTIIPIYLSEPVLKKCLA